LWVFDRGALRATLPSGTADRAPLRQRPSRKPAVAPASRAA